MLTVQRREKQLEKISAIIVEYSLQLTEEEKDEKTRKRKLGTGFLRRNIKRKFIKK